MANSFHERVLAEGALEWNRTRPNHFSRYVAPTVGDTGGLSPEEIFEEMGEYIRRPDLEGVVARDLSDYDLSRANLRNARLSDANLADADFWGADLTGADLSGANLRFANLHHADLTDADLRGAALDWANLSGARIEGARLSHTSVHGTSAWNLRGEPAEQTGLWANAEGEPRLLVDSLRLAQFIHLLSRDSEIREAIDTITARVVLILGRFTKDRKAALDATRLALRARGLVPVVFDFEGPESKDTTGTVETLARMARFVVADLTDPSSIPHELATTVPFLRTTPVVLLRKRGAVGYSMVKDLEVYPWVIPVHEYSSTEELIDNLNEYVLKPVEARLELLRPTDPHPGAATAR